MKLKLHPYKIANLVIIYILFFGVLVYISLNNNLQQSQSELRNFYDAELNNCRITAIKEKPYQGGRGTYILFTTSCSADYYPISPTPFETSVVELFQEGSVISKESRSTKLIITSGDDERTIQMRHYETEDDRPFSLKVIGIFLGLATIIILVIPNSQYEKIGS